MKIKKWIAAFILLVCFSVFFAGVNAESETGESASDNYDSVITNIENIIEFVNEDLCNSDKKSYKQHMTEFARLIVKSEKLAKDLYKENQIDYWYIYNQISKNPRCGIPMLTLSTVKKSIQDNQLVATPAAPATDNSTKSNSCMCWNIATGREDIYGYWKDGACRCTEDNNR